MISHARKYESEPTFELRFPPLPRTIAEVSELLLGTSTLPDTPALVEVVHSDPVVASLVLRRVNSSYNGLRRRIGDIKQAVLLLGFTEVADLVLAASLVQLKEVVRNDEQAEIFEDLMRLSIGAASYAHSISAHLEIPVTSGAFTVGLLRSVGRLVFLYNRAEDYEALWYTNEEGLAPPLRSEQAVFGTDHSVLGALAAEHWHLPAFIGRVIGSFHGGEELHREEYLLKLTVSAAEKAAEHLYLEERGKATSAEAVRRSAAYNALLRNSGREMEVSELADFVEGQKEWIYSYAEAMLGRGAEGAHQPEG